MSKRIPQTERFGKQNAEREDQRRGLRDALRIDGSQFIRLYEKMQVLYADVRTLFDNLDERVTELVYAIIPALTYTRAEIDGKVASPGAIAPTTVTASGGISSAGQVYSAAPLRSPGSRSYVVSSGYAGAWINDDGTIGISPSTRTLKKNLTPMSEPSPADVDAVEALLSLTPHWGHYVWDDDGAPLKSFLIAEEVFEAGFGPDVAPIGPDGEPFTLNYSQLIPALIAALQAQARRIDALENPNGAS